MILDTEQNPKSPTLSVPGSHSQSHVSPRASQNLRGHVSYSTFPTISDARTNAQNLDNTSDLTALLSHSSPFPETINDDEQPPAYDSIDSKRAGGWLWIRGAAVILVVLLTCVVWASYEFSRNIKATPDQPPRPPPETYPPSTIPPPPTSSAQDLPTQIPLPPLPPYNHFPTTPNSPYVVPDVGRIDLCRPWAYSLDTGARPAYSDGKPVDRLVYTIPSIAPIHIEASAICPTSEGLNRYCTEYDNSKDAVSGRLNVVGGDVELPTVELFVQHGSELGLEDLSICLVQQSLSEGEVVGGRIIDGFLGLTYVRSVPNLIGYITNHSIDMEGPNFRHPK
ncbi:hypothetical protein FRC12_018185 [Ceratobasidium sp. 428]|nr:hypothetical protein FRC12_018185 [Ceratobasidium sp. 428]